MAIKLFGFTIASTKQLEDKSKSPSVVLPQNVDGAATLSAHGTGAAFNQTLLNYTDFVTFGSSEVELVNTYRSLALQPEVDEAISDIIHEMVIQNESKEIVNINTDYLPKYYDKEFRDQILIEFKKVLQMLDFNNKSYDIAKQFYVDGRLYYDLIIDEKKLENGIIEVRNFDPRTIKPVREVEERLHPDTGVRTMEVVNEYFAYNPHGITNDAMPTIGSTSSTGAKISKDRVAYVNSGIYTPGNVKVLSHLHKAIKPYNQLRMVEDATVIYRVTRAPERRVFYVDVGDLPANKVEGYINDLVNKYRGKMTYDSNDGKIQDSRHTQSMMEDFFLPRRGSTGKGTEIDTLPPGQNLGEMEDVEYFKRKLYRALNVPLSRIEKDGGTFQLGRVSEISRDEIKFSRFLIRLRDRLGLLFDEILAKHLVFKGIIKTQAEWYQLRQYIHYDFVSDSHFNELKEMEVLSSRLDAVAKMDPYIGRYFSDPFIRDTILKQTQQEQEDIDRSLEEYPHQIPAMILPKNADGMRPADPIAAGLSKMTGNPPPSGNADGGGNAAAPKSGGKAAVGGGDNSATGGKDLGGLGSGFASGAKSGSVVLTGFKTRMSPAKKSSSPKSWGSIATKTSSSRTATEDFEIKSKEILVEGDLELSIDDDGTMQIL